MKRKQFFVTILAIILVVSSIILAFEPAAAVPKANAGLLDPKTIPKYVNQLVSNIPVYTPTNITNGEDEVIRQDYTIDMTYFREQILPTGTPLAVGTDGKTTVWGYAGNAYDAVTGQSIGYFQNSPSATFLATTGIPSKVTWVNKIDVPQFLPVDNTITWADPNGDGTTNTAAPLVPHLHGAEVQSNFDGGPNAWFTFSGQHGSTYSSYESTASNAAVYYYNNEQNPTTLWYHDHALGMTRLNVMSGLAGYYLLRDEPAETTITTPTAENFDQYMNQHFQYGVNEIPLAIQDRSFYSTGELWFPTVGINPTIHPTWMPEFFGDTIMVNGKVWPNLNVTQGVYRFRVLDGSNARFYTLSFDNKMPFTVIGTEGGYLQKPAVVTSLTIAPGERYDIIVDFSKAKVGTKIIMTNDAKAPFPHGATADPQTTGQIMQFTVAGTAAAPETAASNIGASTAPTYPANLNPTLPGTSFPTLPASNLPKRYITLVEIMGPAGPQMVTINGQTFEGTITETPKEGTEEEWVIIKHSGNNNHGAQSPPPIGTIWRVIAGSLCLCLAPVPTQVLQATPRT